MRGGYQRVRKVHCARWVANKACVRLYSESHRIRRKKLGGNFRGVPKTRAKQGQTNAEVSRVFFCFFSRFWKPKKIQHALLLVSKYRVSIQFCCATGLVGHLTEDNFSGTYHCWLFFKVPILHESYVHNPENLFCEG